MTPEQAKPYADVLHAVATDDIVRTFWREPIVEALQRAGLITRALTLTTEGEELVSIIPDAWIAAFR